MSILIGWLCGSIGTSTNVGKAKIEGREIAATSKSIVQKSDI
jgi:hypothetical protein